MNKVSVRLKDESFPPWEKVIPNMTDYSNEGSGIIGVNPWYLVDIVKAFRIPKKATTVVKIQTKKELDPIVVTTSAMPELLIIIMPCRI